MKKTVLITGIGGDVAQGVAMILRECRPDLRLIGVDAGTLHGGREFVDLFEKVPMASESTYLESICAIIRKHDVGIFIPMSEPELDALQLAPEIAELAEVISPGKQTVRVGLDKYMTAKALSELGLPAPWTTVAEDGKPPSLPCILKKRSGSGSRDVVIIADEEDLGYHSKRIANAIYQELLLPADQEVTCAVYRARDGRVAILQLLRRLTGGFTGWAQVINNEDVFEMCARLAAHLDLRGSMNVQLRITPDGPRIFEINPRFSSTALMRHRLGFTDVLWALGEAEAMSPKFVEIEVGRIVVRVQDALVLSK